MLLFAIKILGKQKDFVFSLYLVQLHAYVQ